MVTDIQLLPGSRVTFISVERCMASSDTAAVKRTAKLSEATTPVYIYRDTDCTIDLFCR